MDYVFYLYKIHLFGTKPLSLSVIMAWSHTSHICAPSAQYWFVEHRIPDRIIQCHRLLFIMKWTYEYIVYVLYNVYCSTCTYLKRCFAVNMKRTSVYPCHSCRQFNSLSTHRAIRTSYNIVCIPFVYFVLLFGEF